MSLGTNWKARLLLARFEFFMASWRAAISNSRDWMKALTSSSPDLRAGLVLWTAMVRASWNFARLRSLPEPTGSPGGPRFRGLAEDGGGACVDAIWGVCGWRYDVVSFLECVEGWLLP
jgi:hypothetical protein